MSNNPTTTAPAPAEDPLAEFTAMLFPQRAIPVETWEPRPGAAITRAQRSRIAGLVERLVHLLDETEPDTEDSPVFPGHPSYQVAVEPWLSNRGPAGVVFDIDREEGC